MDYPHATTTGNLFSSRESAMGPVSLGLLVLGPSLKPVLTFFSLLRYL